MTVAREMFLFMESSYKGTAVYGAVVGELRQLCYLPGSRARLLESCSNYGSWLVTEQSCWRAAATTLAAWSQSVVAGELWQLHQLSSGRARLLESCGSYVSCLVQ
ncbi:uncharacterized protein LOC111875458 [Cryptotermes secundus]|uniref:uncharacterized protein LOC111875458 n=1 Tax=Cryptotermes secundus TaxID=105785 RepID=UPI000CD7CD7F|nr:uncharacterized protein LOC111875458 [Cryptotermes secundus]